MLFTYLLLTITTCFISFLSFSLILPQLFLYPLSFPPLPSLSLSLFSSLSPLTCFPKRFISAAQPSNLNWYDDTAVDNMYVCKFLLLSHLISLSLSLSHLVLFLPPSPPAYFLLSCLSRSSRLALSNASSSSLSFKLIL